MYKLTREYSIRFKFYHTFIIVEIKQLNTYFVIVVKTDTAIYFKLYIFNW